MPELPEVETIRRQLAPELEGRTIETVEILDWRWTRPLAAETVRAGLAGSHVKRISRAGKYLIWELSDERYLLMHLRMTGALLFDPPEEPPHVRARFTLTGAHRLVYVDPRRFGTGHLLIGRDGRDAYLQARLGAEPFTPEFTATYLQRLARGRVAPVKAFLLDQRRVAGVGNIYADEALFRAGIHPLRPVGRLTSPQWVRLRDAIEAALNEGIDAKGASIDDFRHLDGERGSFQDRFLIHLRAGEPCVACGGTVQKIVVGGRGTYVCERCQPRPRRRRVARAVSAADVRSR
ncbi:MAG: bifunctional DNA-formamidopyrimidine glycosylase/DNA-(apurinic or apyrimidinic site) lyase [Solirubrobacterales bacterium]|nr:bifunctional DNA-formamidopyrimidine glycosylase/DNA-(apurinic or apyrimidinic site) lyase [Solirubrobacterales bacterium]